MVAAFIFLVLMFITYNYFVFELMDALLENPRLKKLYRLPVGIVNTAVAVLMTMLDETTALTSYILIAIMLFVEFIVFYRDKIFSSLFCMLACALHLMSIRSICVSVFALITGNTFFGVVDNELMLVLSTAVTFLVLNVCFWGVIKFIPAKGIKIINQHSEQLWFMVAWIGVFCVYLLINSLVYNSANASPTLISNQIIMPMVILMGSYIMLFFAMKTGDLLGYKEKTEALEHAVEKERLYRESIDRDVIDIIEVNYSKNYVISGFDGYRMEFGDLVHNYSEMMRHIVRTTVHLDDRDEFIENTSPISVIDAFNHGAPEITFDYRRLMPDNTYLWMQVLLVFMQEAYAGDIKGFVQIKNIDAEKKQQIELQYKAERDVLTRLYNKATTEKLIIEYLNSHKANPVAGVLFVIDIDNFKTINDRFGHLYGDAVLSELSEGLQTIFRDDDIVGRIGGDEFLVFAKGALNLNMIVKKANEICKTFLKTYVNEQKENYTVSSSIGISIMPKDGTDFEPLFKCADAALYTTKAKGKNGYSFFEKDFEQHYVSTRTEIDTHGGVQKSFRDNRIEYVFRLLYGSDDVTFAIESVLELIAKNFRFSRANIFEFDEAVTHFTCVFEWCAEDIVSVRGFYVDVPLTSFEFVISTLEKQGGMFVATPEVFPPHIKENYIAISIKSILHFSIKEGDKLIGVIAFQNCTDDNFYISDAELEELHVICQVLSVFMAKQLSNDREQRHHKAIAAVMNNMNSIAYVIDRENYDVFYENQNVINITKKSSIGDKCYKAYRGFDKPCGDCALNHLSEEKPTVTLELYTEKFDIYTQTSGALVDWANRRPAMLISSIDVTDYKKQEIARAKREKEGINEKFDKQVSALIDRVKIGTWDWELSTDKVIYGEAWAETLGYKKEELEQSVSTWESMVLPEDLVYANKQIERYFNGETELYEAEFRMIRRDGSIIWAQDKGHISERDAEGKPVRFVGVLQDVSRLKNVEIMLKENQETLDLAVNVAELGTWDWDIKNNTIAYNDEYLHMLGLTQEDTNGSMEEWEETNHPEDLPNTMKALDDYIAGKTEKYECEIRMKHRDGHYIWTRDVGRIVARDAEGNPTRIIGGHLNIDELKRSHEQLNALAYIDGLTGLPNLTKFKLEAKEVLESNQDKSFVFAKIDIVNFKMVNDIFGNDVGDAVIKKVADVILRIKKMNGFEIGSFARIHDDVFIVLDESFKESIEEIEGRCRQFENIFNKEMEPILGNHYIKFRYGRFFPQMGDLDVENAVECTTLALSKARANTASRYFDYDLSMKQEIRREVETTNKMQKALENNEFVVFLQGKYSLIDKSLCGAESLARWKVDENTIVSPAEFIPIFEKNGFIINLDMFMFTQCCAIIAGWKAQGLTPVPISVNFSRKHLANPNFAADIAAIADKYGVDPKYLEVELTETIVMDSDNDAMEFIASLHQYGFQISIDDFGTGYSSLGMLKNLNVDTIKLDRSFFMDAQENVKTHSVLSNMINMVIDLGIKTVAEGVEERSQVELLSKLNCDMIQGYYFGRPVAAHEFTQRIHREVNAETMNAVNDKAKRFNLRKNNELLSDMMDSMPLSFTLWNSDIKIVQCNKEAVALLGFKCEEDMLSRMSEGIPEYQPDGTHSLTTIAQRISLAFEHGYGRYTSWYFKHLDGYPLPCEVILVRIVNKGEFMVACYVRDMRYQIEAEESMYQDSKRLKDMLNSTTMCINLWDGEDNFAMCNKAACAMFGIEDERIFLENFLDFCPEYQPDGSKSSERMVDDFKIVREKGVHSFYWQHIRLDGSPVDTNVTLVKLTINNQPMIAAFVRELEGPPKEQE